MPQMYPNVTFAHNNGSTRVDREVRDYNAHARESALGYGRRMYSARTDTQSRRLDNRRPHRVWAYRNKYAGGDDYDPAYDGMYEAHAAIRSNRNSFAAMKIVTGIMPRNRKEFEEMNDQLDPAQQAEVDAISRRHSEEMEDEQAGAARDPARPFGPTYADRVTNWQKRNPGRDKPLDPVGNPNEQQRLALEQSARFLPAELLHMIRPDRRPERPLTEHPGYNSLPARTIRDRNAKPVPANYVHN